MDRTQTCPECKSHNITTDAETYCCDCGYILTARPKIELSEPSWIDETDRRLGPQQSQRWLTTGSCIGYSSEYSETTRRFARYNDRLRSGERTLIQGLREIRSLGATLDFPDSIIERAAYWFRTATSEGLLKGRSIEAMSAASIYIAARERELPITKAEIADQSPVSESRIRGHIGVLQAQLSVSIKPAMPQEFLPKLASMLSISTTHERRARELLEIASEANIHIGKHPAGVAGAAIYTVDTYNGDSLTQADVATAADVSSITISRHHQRLQNLQSTEESIGTKSASGT